MLKKLIKYEWKRVSGMQLILLAVAAAMSLLGVLYFQTPFWKKSVEGSLYSGAEVLGLFLGIGGAILYILMLVGVRFAQIIYLGVNYFKSMFSDEGYLTHTLPVTPAQLLFSKVLVSGLWMMIMNLVLTGLTALLILCGACSIGAVSLADIMDGFRLLFDELAPVLESQGIHLVSFAAILIFLVLAGPFLSVAILFGGLNLGSYSAKNKALVGILCYFGITVVSSILGNVVNGVVNFLAMTNRNYTLSLYNSQYMVSSVISVVLCAVLMVWSNQILKNHLNME